MVQDSKISGLGRWFALALGAGVVFIAGYTVAGLKTASPAGSTPESATEALPRAGAAMVDEAAVRRIVEAYIKENPVVIMQSVNDYQQFGFTRQIAAQALPYRKMLEDTTGVPVVGDAGAEVKIIEFFDYRCPHCKSNYPVLKRILAEDPTVVLVPKQLPILGDGGPDDMSRYAARAALAAHMQGKFAAMHEALLASPVPLSRQTILATAASIDLDITKLEADMTSADVEKQLQASLTIANEAGFAQAGTPGYMIGGEVSIGAGDDAYERLKAMIEAARNPAHNSTRTAG